MRLSVVIPNYNGRRLLEQNVPPLLEELARLEGESELVIVDDGSTDGSAELVGERFPTARLLVHEKNLGFGAAATSGVHEASAPLVMLLNSDARPLPGSLPPLLAPFAAGDVFAVGATEIRAGAPPGPGPVVLTPPRFRAGFLRYHETAELPPESECTAAPALFVSGGWSVFDRAKLLELGGFDPLYEPFYLEDVDVCYRAWKRGWRVLCAPGSRVLHEHARGAVASHFSRRRTDAILRRNRILFTWKNVHSRRLFGGRHLLPLALRTMLGPLVLDLRMPLALFLALPRLRRALAARRVERQNSTLSDEEVLEKIRAEWERATGLRAPRP